MFNRFFIFSACLFIFSCKNNPRFFTKLSSSNTGISFANNLEKRKGLNILYYLYYYNGGGVATGDINNDGLADIYFTANSKGANKLYLNKGNFQFEDIAAKAGVAGISDWCTGVTMADINADGFLDIYVCSVQGEQNLHGYNMLYINNKNGTFTDKLTSYVSHTSFSAMGSDIGDINNDGLEDIYVVDMAVEEPTRQKQLFAVNQNYDKFQLLLKFNLFYQYPRNSLQLNNTDGTFSEIASHAGVAETEWSWAPLIADLDNDGWKDIYVTN